MHVEIAPELQDFITDAVRDGRYASVDAVLGEGLRLLAERDGKLADLRATIDASIARGGAYSDEEVGRYLEGRRAKRRENRAACQ